MATALQLVLVLLQAESLCMNIMAPYGPKLVPFQVLLLSIAEIRDLIFQAMVHDLFTDAEHMEVSSLILMDPLQVRVVKEKGKLW